MKRENKIKSDFISRPQIKIIREGALKCRCGIEMELLLVWAALRCILKVNGGTCLFK